MVYVGYRVSRLSSFCVHLKIVWFTSENIVVLMDIKDQYTPDTTWRPIHVIPCRVMSLYVMARFGSLNSISHSLTIRLVNIKFTRHRFSVAVSRQSYQQMENLSLPTDRVAPARFAASFRCCVMTRTLSEAGWKSSVGEADKTACKFSIPSHSRYEESQEFWRTIKWYRIT